MMLKAFDSWAIIGWLQEEEPVCSHVDHLLAEAAKGQTTLFMSMINLGEVFYILAKRNGPDHAEQFLADVPAMPIQVLVPDKKLILNAARLKSRFSISYADAFAIETAKQQRAALVTGDPEIFAFAQKEPFELEWLG